MLAYISGKTEIFSDDSDRENSDEKNYDKENSLMKEIKYRI